MSLNNTNGCGECQDQTPCTPICTGCPVLISSDCVNNFTEDLVYSGIIKGQTLTEVFVQFDEYINTRFGTSSDYISLINIGTGSQIYKGISPVGKKQIRSLLGSSLVNVTQNTDDIIISVNAENLGTFVRSNQNTYSVSNIGTGASVYKNTTSLLNNVQTNLKRLKSSNNSVTITEGLDDINFSVVGVVYQAGAGISLVGNTFSNTSPDQVVSIIGAGATTVSGTYPNFSISTTVPNGSETKLSAGSNITVSGSGTIASPYTISAASGSVPDGSETKLSAGSNISITGSGTIASPYAISATDTNTTYDGSETKLTASTNITITGTGTVVNPYVISAVDTNTTYDGSETKLASSSNISITGSGTIASPYTISATDTNTTYSAGVGLALSGTVFNLDNLQRIITYPADFIGTNYTLVDGDNNYELIINNGATAVTITIPSGLMSKFGAGFTQEGSADVAYVQSGTTINTPVGLKIKGQFYQTYLSQKGATNTYFLGGNTKL